VTFSERPVCAKCAQTIESKGDAFPGYARALERKRCGTFELPIANNIKCVTALVNTKSRKIKAKLAVLAVPKKFRAIAALTMKFKREIDYPLYC